MDIMRDLKANTTRFLINKAFGFSIASKCRRMPIEASAVLFWRLLLAALVLGTGFEEREGLLQLSICDDGDNDLKVLFFFASSGLRRKVCLQQRAGSLRMRNGTVMSR